MYSFCSASISLAPPMKNSSSSSPKCSTTALIEGKVRAPLISSGLEVITTLVLLGKGLLPIASHVFLPITTTLPVVSFLKRTKSSLSR